jgi:hypothetical protein
MPRPISIPHMMDALRNPNSCAHHFCVCRRRCGRWKRSISKSRSPSIKAAQEMLQKDTTDSRKEMFREGRREPNVNPTTAAVVHPTTVYAPTQANQPNRFFVCATFPRGVRAPISERPQSPPSCVHPKSKAIGQIANKGLYRLNRYELKSPTVNRR